MELGNIKTEILKKYAESKQFLSSIDFWSNVTKPNHFTFKTSQQAFQYLKNNSDIDVLEEKVSSGKLAIVIKIDDIKLDDYILDTIEIVQDVEIKTNNLTYMCANFTIKKEFNTRNMLGQKDINIFDIKVQDKSLNFKLKTRLEEYIELCCSLG